MAKWKSGRNSVAKKANVAKKATTLSDAHLINLLGNISEGKRKVN
jgi:hypothetical protein